MPSYSLHSNGTRSPLILFSGNRPDHRVYKKDPSLLGGLALPLAKVVYRTLLRFYRKRDHGLRCTLVEGHLREIYVSSLGKWVLDSTKTNAQRMWAANDGLEPAKWHAGAYFLARLANYQEANPQVTFDLCAVDVGAVAVCHLVEAIALRHPAMRLRRIALIAPACTLSLFAATLAAHVGMFERLRVFLLADDAERRDALVPLVYPRSSLYFVSGVLEAEADQPLLGLDRHLSGKKPYDDSPLPDVARFLHEPGRGGW